MSTEEQEDGGIARNSWLKIKEIRRRLGSKEGRVLSQTEFAERIGLGANQSMVAKWESQTQSSLPNLARLRRIAELGGVSVDYIQDHSVSVSYEDFIESGRQIGGINEGKPGFKSAVDDIGDITTEYFLLLQKLKAKMPPELQKLLLIGPLNILKSYDEMPVEELWEMADFDE